MDHLKKSIAIHQPNYIPWIGYFFKIFMSDIFVFHDDVIFSSKSYTKRSLFRKEFHSQETQWLGVSVSNSKDQKISEILIDHENQKIKKHLLKMEYLYHNTPYFDLYFPKIKVILNKIEDFETLTDFNIYTIKELATLLGINSEFHQSSNLSLNRKGNEYNVEIVKHFDCHLYYSGVGAKEYQNANSFEQNNIELIYLDTPDYQLKKPYPQHQGDFLPGLSIIDTIMNIGSVGVRDIFYSMRNEFNPHQAITYV